MKNITYKKLIPFLSFALIFTFCFRCLPVFGSENEDKVDYVSHITIDKSTTDEELATLVYEKLKDNEGETVKVIDKSKKKLSFFNKSKNPYKEYYYTIRNVKTMEIDSEEGKESVGSIAGATIYMTIPVSIRCAEDGNTDSTTFSSIMTNLRSAFGLSVDENATSWTIPKTNEGKKVDKGTMYMPNAYVVYFELYKKDDNSSEWEKVDNYRTTKDGKKPEPYYTFTYVE